MPRLSTDNANAFAHRVAGNSPVYERPNCEYGEVLVTDRIESSDAGCLDCGARYCLRVDEVSGPARG